MGTYQKEYLSAQSCPTLCDPMDCSTLGFPVYHQLPELTQTYIGDQDGDSDANDVYVPEYILLKPFHNICCQSANKL